MTNIRTASLEDSKAIQSLYRAAFPDNEAERIALLADDLLKEVTDPETFTLVTEDNRCIAGAVSFSPVSINTDSSWQGYILAPLGVMPEAQKKGLGTVLVRAGLDRLAGQGVNAVLVYGDPGYYGRFGFDAETASNIQPPYPLEYPHGWLAFGLNDEIHLEAPCELSCVASLNDPGLW